MRIFMIFIYKFIGIDYKGI